MEFSKPEVIIRPMTPGELAVIERLPHPNTSRAARALVNQDRLAPHVNEGPLFKQAYSAQMMDFPSGMNVGDFTLASDVLNRVIGFEQSDERDATTIRDFAAFAVTEAQASSAAGV